MVNKGYVICYERLENLSGKEQSKMTRELFGYQDKSNYGKYSYTRKGLLSDLPYYSPMRSVLVVRKQDGGRIIEYLKEKAKVYYWEINLSEKDKEQMYKKRIGGWYVERKTAKGKK
jgi:hypothetical protein